MTDPFHHPSPRELEHAVREFAAQIMGSLAPMVFAVEPGKLDPSRASVGVRPSMVPLVLDVAWGLAEAAVQYRYRAREESPDPHAGKGETDA